MILKSNILIPFAVLTVLILVPFQNCSNVEITKMSVIEEPPIAKMDITAQSCVNAKTLAPEKTKFVFILDLSRSNLGDFYGKNLMMANGQLNPNKAYFFSTDSATDPNGVRFDALTNFIDTCGSADPDTEYSVIGFSNDAGSLQTSSTGKSLVCQPGFDKADVAKNQLQALKDLQMSEKNVYTQFVEPTKPYSSSIVAPLVSKETNYVAATDCLSKTVEKDLLSNSTAINYQVFFISDGAAMAKTTGCEDPTVGDKVACYTEKMEASLNYTMKLATAKSKNIRIHSIYYTKSGLRDPIIEKYMKYLSVIGQTRDPVNLGDISATGTTSGNKFCDLLAVDRSIVFKTSAITAVNKNRIRIGGQILSDSDADGITDIDEENLFHSDPQKSRSMVPDVLDGVCKILGGLENCQLAKSKTTCDPSLINQFGISDCDVKVLRLNQIAPNPNLVGIDSDNDGIPDYIEILKGLNPATADSNLDPDNDGLTNIEEISLGHDPFVPDPSVPPLITFDLAFSDSIEGCTSGGWTYTIKSMMSSEGANNVLLYFKTISQNSVNESEFKAFTLKMKFNLDDLGKNLLTSSLSHSSVSPGDFVLVEKATTP